MDTKGRQIVNSNVPGFGTTATDNNNIVSLDTIVATWILYKFETCGAEAARLKFEDLDIYIDWSRVEFFQGQVEYKDREAKKPEATNHTLFRTHFSNNTQRGQEYTFRSVQMTEQIIDVSFSKAFKCSAQPPLKLKTPQDVIESGGSISKEFCFKCGKNETKAEEVTWSVDSNVRVKNLHRTEATINLVEREFDKVFSFETRVSGTLGVTFYSKLKRKPFHHIVTASIADVVKKVLDEGWMPAGSPTFEIGSEENGVPSAIMIIRGALKFHLGVEQNVLLDEQPC